MSELPPVFSHHFLTKRTDSVFTLFSRDKRYERAVLGCRGTGGTRLNTPAQRSSSCPYYSQIALRNQVSFKSAAEAEDAGYRVAENCP